jgi:ATP-dependent DNA helicase RecQ
VPDLLSATLERFWGYTAFRPLQREAILAITSRRDSLAVLPTGAGKSICFQLPALLSDVGVALVVSPLISLMKDQVDTLVGNGVPAACFHSGLDADAKRRTERLLADGRCRLLYVAPERLTAVGWQGIDRLLGGQPVPFVAIDEAHCISQWGHDFRPEYRQLATLRERWPEASVHAFTATATRRVRADIIEQLQLREPAELVGSFDRPNLVYRVLARSTLKRQIEDVLKRHTGEAGIIYCQSRREVDELAAWLSESGHAAVPYHAGLDDDTRHRNQDAFINEESDLVVATVAFGMGIDRSNVRFVLHAGAPQSLEHYQQESGRAGRDGLEAECLLIYSPGDFARWRSVIDESGENTAARRALLTDMSRYASGVRCRHRHLVEYFGQSYAGRECGACDVCLGELEPVPDAATLARKILSAVARLEQRFGAMHVTNVLRGRKTELVTSRGHDRLSVFGLLAGASVDEARGYIDQLVGAGFLRQTDDQYSVLRLTADGVALLKDAAAAEGLALARQRVPERGTRGKRTTKDAASWEGVDRELFERLRVVRTHLARERAVPPYVIFHDATLRELARLKPTDVQALRHVYGIGEGKAEALGERVVAAIREYLR